MKILRMIPNNEFHKIRDGKYRQTYCRVYYGYNCYRNDPEFINDIVQVIKCELPGITNDQMHIHCITMDESITHYRFTTVQIIMKADDVKKNLSSYTIL